MNITSQVFETNESLRELSYKLSKLHSIYFVREIVEDDDLSKKLNLKDQNFELFESFVIKIIEDTIQNFTVKAKASPLKKQIIKEIDLLIKDLKNRLYNFENDLKDDYTDPFSNEKNWKNPQNNLWKFYSIVHLSILESVPLILKNVKIQIKTKENSSTEKSEFTQSKNIKRLTSRQILLIIKIFKKCKIYPNTYDKSAEQRLLSAITGFATTSFRDNNDFVDSIIDMSYLSKHSDVLSNYLIPIEEYIKSSNESSITELYQKLKSHYSKF